MNPWAGAASVAGTRAFARRAVEAGHAAPEHFRLTVDGRTVSSLGLGTYLGNPDSATDRAVEHAVQVAVGSGRVNVIDTAINYRYQRAERSVGRTLQRLADAGRSREELFLATKVGYLAPDGESELPPRAWVDRELIASGVLDPSEIVDGSHAMTPRYLADQLKRSRSNLGVETVDLVYLHNAPDAQLPEVGMAEFLARLRAAFQFLEEERAAGRLGSYGLATWTSLRVPAGDPSHLSLETALEIARDVGGADHGFRYVQMPLNLGMPEAYRRTSQVVAGVHRTALGAAEAFGLGVFTSVPLLQGRLARQGPTQPGLTRAQTALQFARSCPGVLAALVGQKSVEHLAENLALAEQPPWGADELGALLS